MYLGFGCDEGSSDAVATPSDEGGIVEGMVL